MNTPGPAKPSARPYSSGYNPRAASFGSRWDPCLPPDACTRRKVPNLAQEPPAVVADGKVSVDRKAIGRGNWTAAEQAMLAEAFAKGQIVEWLH